MKNYFRKLNFYLDFLGLTFRSISPCRIYQILYFKNFKFRDDILEFGVENYKNSFSNLTNLDKNKIFTSNQYKSNKKNYIQINLENKNIIFKKFTNIIIFNVIEHIFDTNNALDEINKLLKKNAKLILSTPFLYRYHSAPNDYLRFTENFLNKILTKKKFKILHSKSCGTGPLLACYAMIFDYIKIVPLLAPITLFHVFILDYLISLFQKTEMCKIYPICVIVEAKK
jgi:SAM-dependent methyltransferase